MLSQIGVKILLYRYSLSIFISFYWIKYYSLFSYGRLSFFKKNFVIIEKRLINLDREGTNNKFRWKRFSMFESQVNSHAAINRKSLEKYVKML